MSRRKEPSRNDASIATPTAVRQIAPRPPASDVPSAIIGKIRRTPE